MMARCSLKLYFNRPVQISLSSVQEEFKVGKFYVLIMYRDFKDALVRHAGIIYKVWVIVGS